MKVVAGLGNPGREYDRTPHNVGFDVLDRVARDVAVEFGRSFRFDARLAKGVFLGEDLWLVKPQTYMNNSGQAVAAVVRYRKLGPGDLVVVLDDADLELGRIRIRAKGGSGGHKGLASIIQHVGSDEFPRVRIGIGRDARGVGLVEHVLKPFSREEWGQVEPVLDRAAEAVRCLLEAGTDAAMNRFNA